AASGWTMSSSEPARKTVAWITASNSGWMATSGGMSGKTAAPSGTCDAPSSAMSPSGHRRDDTERVAVLHGGIQIIQVAYILIIEIEVDELANLAVLEQPIAHTRVLARQVFQRGLDGSTGGLHSRLTGSVLSHRSWYVNPNCHDAS